MDLIFLLCVYNIDSYKMRFIRSFKHNSSQTPHFLRTNDWRPSVARHFIAAEEELDIDLAPPSKPSEDEEVNGTDQPNLEGSVADENEHGKSNGIGECMPEDVTMSDGESSGQVESIKLCFLERSKDNNIQQLERLYTHVVKGIFETKSRVKVEDLKDSILRFLLEFAKGESKF